MKKNIENNSFDISIIIPVHNSIDTLHRCVQSFRNETNTHFEIIIVENCSTDGTYELSNNLSKKFPFLKVIHTDQKGVSNARNLGIKASRGYIIGFCDADDTYEEGTLDRVTNIFSTHPEISMVNCGYRKIYLNGNVQEKKYPRNQIISSNKQYKRTLTDSRTFGHVVNKFFKKTLIDDIKFDKTLTHWEDSHFNCLVLLQNPDIKIYSANFIVYNYFNNEDSVMHAKENYYTEDNKNKFIIGINNILKTQKLTKYQKKYLFVNKYMLSTSAYYFTSFNAKQKSLLLKEIKDCWFTFIRFVTLHPTVLRFKYVAGGLLAILHLK